MATNRGDLVENRKNDLLRLCEGLDDSVKTATKRLIDEIVFLEMRLDALKEYPFIEVNPKNPVQQRATYAAKQYKELLQQYNNCLKILLGVLNKVEGDEISPLRQYLNEMRERNNA